MSNTIKKFDHRVIKMKQGDNVPSNPYVEILLDHWMKNVDDTPIISSHLMTEAEIDLYIQQLKADLDAVGKRAKSALLRAQDETKAIVAARISN